MDRQVKIFLAEDNDGLRTLIGSTLTDAGFLVDPLTCGKELLDRLEIEKPDLLLLDYKLPDMKTPRILDELEKMGLQIPFIIVTGHGDEKIAVEMMKRGAVDYIIKDIKLLDILPGMIKRAAKELLIKEKLRLTENQLSHTRTNYQLLSQNIADVIWTINFEQQLTYASPSIEKLLQYTPDELKQKSLADFVEPETAIDIHPLFTQMLTDARQGEYKFDNKSIKRFETNMIRKDGSRVWTESQISTLANSNSRI